MVNSTRWEIPSLPGSTGESCQLKHLPRLRRSDLCYVELHVKARIRSRTDYLVENDSMKPSPSQYMLRGKRSSSMQNAWRKIWLVDLSLSFSPWRDRTLASMLTKVCRLPYPSTQWPIARLYQHIAWGIFNASCGSVKVYNVLICLKCTSQD